MREYLVQLIPPPIAAEGVLVFMNESLSYFVLEGLPLQALRVKFMVTFNGKDSFIHHGSRQGKRV